MGARLGQDGLSADLGFPWLRVLFHAKEGLPFGERSSPPGNEQINNLKYCSRFSPGV